MQASSNPIPKEKESLKEEELGKAFGPRGSGPEEGQY